VGEVLEKCEIFVGFDKKGALKILWFDEDV
jgi:hypothetical protein